MGTPLGPKYISYTYMDPLGFRFHPEACSVGLGLTVEGLGP